MSIHLQTEQVTVHHGDCLDVMRELADSSVDAIVTDPPYNLSFMSKPWDAYNGQEDAGFASWLSGLIDGEGHFAIKHHTRDTYAPAFTLKLRADERGTLKMIVRKVGVGSINIEAKEPNPMVKWVVQDKAGCQRLVDLLDKYPLRAKKLADYWAWRDAVCEWTSRPRGNRWHGAADGSRMEALRERLMSGRAYSDVPWSGNEFQDWCRLWATECLRVLKPGGHLLAFGGTRTWHRLAVAIEDAGFEMRDSIAWLHSQGFPKGKSQLKPAFEPIVVARKPHTNAGTLNIDACRVETNGERFGGGAAGSSGFTGGYVKGSGFVTSTQGRWPTNVALDGDIAAALDEQSGTLKSGAWNGVVNTARAGQTSKGDERERPRKDRAADSGGASRFFPVFRYQAKAPTRERPKVNGIAHPTCKPLTLMRWLVRLVTPPGGIVLDPFAGSGTTIEACIDEDMRCIGIEREADYLPLIDIRIARAIARQQAATFTLFDEDVS